MKLCLTLEKVKMSGDMGTGPTKGFAARADQTHIPGETRPAPNKKHRLCEGAKGY